MAQRSHAQVIETFHLAFLRVLAANNSSWFILKGGANLRYFFASPRYSNDIDLDFVDRTSWGISKTIDSVLTGTALTMLSKSSNFAIDELSAPKQTPTTLRWKIGLRCPEHKELIRTKIEFSGRQNESTDIEFEVVPDEIVRPYGLNAPLVKHYGAIGAINQKIAALALRGETKARDVFDLDLMLRKFAARDDDLAMLEAAHADAAALRSLEVPFSSFTSEVAPFLDPEIAALFNGPSWEATCLSLSEALSRIGQEPQSNGRSG